MTSARLRAHARSSPAPTSGWPMHFRFPVAPRSGERRNECGNGVAWVSRTLACCDGLWTVSVGWPHGIRLVRTADHNAAGILHDGTTYPGPDLRNILRQSYDYLTIMPKLRLWTYPLIPVPHVHGSLPSKERLRGFTAICKRSSN